MNATNPSVQYTAALDLISAAALSLEGQPFDEIIATLDRADSVGSILYPTEYRDALQSGSLAAQRALVVAAKAFVDVLSVVREAYGIIPRDDS